jgi:hypothetical protein
LVVVVVVVAVVGAFGSSPHPVPGGLWKDDHGPLVRNNAPEDDLPHTSTLRVPWAGAVEAHRSMQIDAAMAPGIGTAPEYNPMEDHTPMPTGHSRKIDRKEMMSIGLAYSWSVGDQGRILA